ncbi:hypothetical protein [Streptomyces sp. NPDC048516]|uniref:hypothetical protein n=1 Tax=Streptomyces sp. NPDC048516 TaxID=3365565 RepID=UPI003724A3A9
MRKTRIVTRSVLGLAAGAVAVLTAVGPAGAATSPPGDTHWNVAATSPPGDTHWNVALTATGTGTGTGDSHGGTTVSSDDTHW